MFSKGLNKNIRSGAGEDFAARSVRKKGRSLSQTSFLFGNNFIPLPQSFELIDRKKTLAFAPSFKWNRETNIIPNHEQRSFNYDSSENNFCSTSSAPSNSNQNLFFLTENNSRLSKTTQPHNDSRTHLSTSYRYNPISLENQLCLSVSRDENSTPSSFTSVKNHILENIPINLISNLSIFLNNKNNYPSFITSKSNVYQKNDVLPKNHQTSFAISGSEVTLRDEQYYRRKSQSLDRSLVSQRRTRHQLNQHCDALANCRESQSKHDQVIILKPASDSLSVTHSSESVIMNTIGENRPYSETTSDSKSIFNVEENNLHVHYMNDSETNESEYSLLISKGYTFAEKQRSKGVSKQLGYLMEEQRGSCESASDRASSHSVETELRVINFLDYEIENTKAKEINLTNDSVPTSKINNPCLKRTVSSTLDQEAFLSCASVVKPSLVSHLQQSSRVIQRKSIESGSGYSGGHLSSKKSIRGRSNKLLPKEENLKKLQESPPRKSRNEDQVTNCGFGTKGEVTSMQESCDESLFDGKNQNIRNAVERIHDRLLKHAELFDIEGESISETYTGLSNEISQLYHEEDEESISEASSTHRSDTTFCTDDHLFRSNLKSRKYPRSKYFAPLTVPRQRRKSELAQKVNFRWENLSDISSVQSSISRSRRKLERSVWRKKTDRKVVSKFKKTSRRKSRSTSSQSSLMERQRYSRCSVTSNSTNFSVYKSGYRSLKGRSRRSSTYWGRNKTKDKKISMERISKKPRALKKMGRTSKKLNELKVEPPFLRRGFYDVTSRDEECRNSSQEAENIDPNNKQENAPVFSEIQEPNSGEREALMSSNSKQVVLNFIDRKEMVNLSKHTETRDFVNQNVFCDNSCENNPYHNDINESVTFPTGKDVKKTPSNNRKLGNNFLAEMDVYTRNDMKRSTIVKDVERTIMHQSIFEHDVKNDAVSLEKELFFERKDAHQVVAGTREIYPSAEPKDSVHHEKVKQRLILPDKSVNSVLANDAHSSPNSCKITNGTSLIKEDNKTYDNEIRNKSNKFVIMSNNSACSDVSTPYDPSGDNESTLHDSESNHSICDSTSEYISWAKRCIFKQRDGASRIHHDSSFLIGKEEQHHHKHVSEAGDGINRIKNAHTCHQSNFSVDDSVCPHLSKTSNETESTTDTKSALSIIPEEKDGSSDRLKSSLSSRTNNNSLRHSKQSLFSSEYSVQHSNGVINTDCMDNSRDSLVRTKELVKRARKQKLKSKSKRPGVLSSDSEEDYRKFKEEMNYYSKSAAGAGITPRILPSSSTFTPDLSSSRVNWDC